MKDNEKQYKKEIEAMKYFANKNAMSMFDIVKNCEHKEKQIEEMARIIAFDLCPFGKLHAKLYGNQANCASNDNFAECTKINKVVENLYEQGYRKIEKDSILLSKTDFDLILPPDSVVLSREEYEKLKMLEEGHITCEDVLEFVEKARKETAEKILNEIYAVLWDEKTPIANSFVNLDVKIREIATRENVEIKE